MQCKSCYTCTRTVRLYLLHTCTNYLGSFLVAHHIYERNRAKTDFMQVNKTRTTFGNPDQIWQPKVVRNQTNFHSEKWSTQTTFCPDQFPRDTPSRFRTLGTSLDSLPGCFMQSTKTPICQYTCMTETSHMAHLTYVSTRYGLGPSTLGPWLCPLVAYYSITGCFMHSTETQRCVYVYLVKSCVCT